MTSSEDRTPSPTTSADTSATPPSTQATSSPPTPPTTTAKPASESPKVYSYSPPPSPNLLPQEQSQRAPILIPPEVAAWPTFICYPSLMRAHWYHGLRVPLSAEAYDDVVSLVAEIVASGAPAPVHATALAFGTQVARSRVADKALRRVVSGRPSVEVLTPACTSPEGDWTPADPRDYRG